MRRSLIYAICAAAMIFTGYSARAAGTEVVIGGHSYEAKIIITEKMVNDDSVYSHGRLGYYVFIASAHTDGVIDVQAIENTADCTAVRPRFGLTEPTSGYFKFPAYAVYYGPYDTFQEAQKAKSAVSYCVEDAYVSAGVMQRL